MLKQFSYKHRNLPEDWIAHNIDDRVEQCSQPVDGVGGYVCLVAWIFRDHQGSHPMGNVTKLRTSLFVLFAFCL